MKKAVNTAKLQKESHVLPLFAKDNNDGESLAFYKKASKSASMVFGFVFLLPGLLCLTVLSIFGGEMQSYTNQMDSTSFH